MKCINSRHFRALSLLLVVAFCLTGCSSKSLDFPYDPDNSNNSFTIDSGNTSEAFAKTFASDLCVTENDLNTISVTIDSSEAGGLFDVTSAETIFAKNVHNQMNPASLTKVMTCYLALKYGHPEDILTASSNVIITESGAQVLGLKEGDKMTLEQALHALMLYSANDVAVLIAEYLSGSVEKFAEVMNKEAIAIGATNSHFVNPNGLTDEEHYSSAYDLYLIMNSAMQYEKFRKIINTKEYTVTYKDRDGNPKTKDISNTNSYLSGKEKAPDTVSVIGGKTGTTKAAGSCLILLCNGTNGHTYISVILNSTDHDSLYADMYSLLQNIN